MKASAYLFLAPLLASAPLAQGAFVPTQDWVVAQLGGDFSVGSCPGVPPRVSAELGTLALDGAHAYAWDSLLHEVCGDAGATSSSPSEVGDWALQTDGLFSLQPHGSMAAPRSFHLPFDHGALLWDGQAGDAPRQALGLALSSGQGEASLAGDYWIGRLRYGQLPEGLVAETSLGEVTFDGLGGYGTSGVVHRVSALGSLDTPLVEAGAYTIADDGRLLLDGQAGAVRADGELAFWVEQDGPWVGLALATRKGTGKSLADLDGSWQLAVHWLFHGDPPNLPAFTELTTELHVDAASGAFTVVGPGQTWSPAGLNHLYWNNGGVMLMQPDGATELYFGGVLNTNAGRLSAQGDFFFLIDAGLPSFADMELAVPRCGAPVPFGSGTPGASGLAPGLGALSAVAGSLLSLDLAGGAPGAPAALVVATAPSANGSALALFGGEVWLDPTTIVLVAPTLLDSLGAGHWQLPLNASAAGVTAYAQAGVLDAGAPGAIALSNALALQVCAP